MPVSLPPRKLASEDEDALYLARDGLKNGGNGFGKACRLSDLTPPLEAGSHTSGTRLPEPPGATLLEPPLLLEAPSLCSEGDTSYGALVELSCNPSPPSRVWELEATQAADSTPSNFGLEKALRSVLEQDASCPATGDSLSFPSWP